MPHNMVPKFLQNCNSGPNVLVIHPIIIFLHGLEFSHLKFFGEQYYFEIEETGPKKFKNEMQFLLLIRKAVNPFSIT